DAPVDRGRRARAAQLVDRRAPADAARAVGHELPPRLEHGGDARRGGADEEHVDDGMDPALVGVLAMLDGAAVACRADDALPEEEAPPPRALPSRRPHDDRERAAVKPDVERLLGGGGVDVAGDASAGHARHLDRTNGRQIVVAGHDFAATVMISTRARAIASETSTGVTAAFAPNAARHAAAPTRPHSSSLTSTRRPRPSPPHTPTP